MVRLAYELLDVDYSSQSRDDVVLDEQRDYHQRLDHKLSVLGLRNCAHTLQLISIQMRCATSALTALGGASALNTYLR